MLEEMKFGSLEVLRSPYREHGPESPGSFGHDNPHSIYPPSMKIRDW